MIYQKLKYYILTLVGVISLLALVSLNWLEYNYDFESFFPRNNPETEFFKEYRAEFETDNDYILIGIKNSSGIFKQDFLVKVDSLTHSLEKLEHVERVISPTNVKDYRRYAMHPALVELPYIKLNRPESWEKDSARIFQTHELRNTLFSSSSPSIAILIKHTPLLDNAGCAQLSEQTRALVSAMDFEEVHYAGRSQGQTIYIQIVENETLVFVGSSVLLVIIFLFIAYRRFWGIWIPLSVVGLVVLWTMSVMVLTGKKIDLMTNIVPTVLMVIGISAVVHLLTHYLQQRKLGFSREEALMVSVKHIGFATFLTTLTTMIGFLTLLTSSVQPIVDLGIYASIGLVFSFLLTYSWFPSILLIHKPLVGKTREMSSDFWLPFLNRINRLVQKRYKVILIICTLIAGLSLWGSFQIQKDNYILEGLKANHPQRLDFNFFEQDFSGARPFEMKIWISDSSKTLFDREILNQIEKLHKFLEQKYGVGGLVSPVSIIRNANKIWNKGNLEEYKIPESDKKLKKLQSDLFRYAKQTNTGVYLKRNHREARLVGKIPDWGSFLVNQKNDTLQQFYGQQLDTNLIKYRLTGSATLMDINTNYVAQNVIEGLLIAVGVIGLIVGFLFRSIKMALISLIPNLLPLLVCGGIMGVFHIDFNLPTSIIFIIAFGIAVDDSIHFLTRFKQELEMHSNDLSKALKGTFLTTGKAIVVTTLILSGGFLTLCLSDFLGTFYIGLLVCITLLLALLADLFLLPAVIIAVWKVKK